jgi:aminopeptidase N
VQAPAGYQVLANGTLGTIDTLAYGQLVWNYQMDRPIPPYTMVVAVGKFAITRLPDAACAVRCVPQAVWTAPEDSAFAVGGPFRRVGEIVEFYSRLIGPFPYSSLAHVEAITPYGGMENATAIFYNDSLYRARALPEQTVAHEVAHQWFGDAVTEDDWHHLWLSEGFATYLAAMWSEHAGGAPALATAMRKEADAYFASAEVDRPILDPAVRNLDSLLNENNYQKGAWVLHQLRGMIGDSLFVAGLRAYYVQYRDSAAVSEDFARNGISARRSLSPATPCSIFEWPRIGASRCSRSAKCRNPSGGPTGFRRSRSRSTGRSSSSTWRAGRPARRSTASPGGRRKSRSIRKDDGCSSTA